MFVAQPSSDPFTPGSWHPTRDRHGHQRARFVCPNGHGMHLPHSITAAGHVTPSVVCPGDPAAGIHCDFHLHIRLEGWNGGNVPRAD